MNRCRESDSLIVSEKPLNKICDNKHVAEKVEKRRLAKGNPSKRNKGWTQSQITLPSELERVRQKAEKDKGIQFTAIWHHVCQTERLQKAYRNLKRWGVYVFKWFWTDVA